MQAKKYADLPIREIATQIASRQKAARKLPTWLANPEVIFPPKENLEQASSEITAKFKSRWVSGNSILDLTGGSGVDLFFMGEGFESLNYVEPDAHLCDLVKFNFDLFGKSVSVHQKTAEQFLENSNEQFDVIYLDPSRRDSQKKKVFGLEQYQPNVIELYDRLVEQGKTIVIKVSPMVDIKQTLRLLPHAFRAQVVAVDNEVKEALFYLKKGFEGESEIEAWNLSEVKKEQEFRFTFKNERQALPEIGSVNTFLYEPNAAIRKAGGFSLIASRFNLSKLHSHTHLYTSDKITPDFPGRIFAVQEQIKPKEKDLKKRFPNGQVNVISRNYPLKPNDLKKKFGLKDGGEEFLIFCDTETDGKSVLICTQKR